MAPNSSVVRNPAPSDLPPTNSAIEPSTIASTQKPTRQPLTTNAPAIAAPITSALPRS